MNALILPAFLICGLLPNRWIAPALPLIWVFERLLPADDQVSTPGGSAGPLIAEVGPIGLSPADLIIILLLFKLAVSPALHKKLVIEPSLCLALGFYLSVNLLTSLAAGIKFGETALLGSLTSWARFVAEALVIVIISQTIQTSAQAKRVLRILLGTLVLLAVIQFVNFFGASHGFVIGEVQGLERGEPRYFGPVGDGVGMVLLLGYLVALCLASVTGAALFLGGILLTAGLGAAVATCVATALFLFFGLRTTAVRDSALRRLSLLPLLALAALVSLSLFSNSLDTTLRDRLTSGDYLESGAGRAASAKLAVDMFLDNPLLGVGYMNYERALGRYDGDAYFDLQHSDGGTANANNQILQALTDGGIVGLLAFAVLTTVAARLFLRVASRSDDRFLSTYYLAAFLWLLTQVLANQAAAWLIPSSFVARLLWVLLGVAVGVARLLPVTQSDSTASRPAPAEPELLRA
jgi:O-antigen ligase